MATSDLVSTSFGDLLLECGSGSPDHTSPKGSLYSNHDTGRRYINTDAGTTWRPTDAKAKSITVEDPSSSEDLTMFFTDRAITINEMEAVLANGASTPSVTWKIFHHTDRSNAGNAVVTAGTTTTSVSTGSIVTSFNDATIPANSWVWIETTAQSGTVPELHVTIQFTED